MLMKLASLSSRPIKADEATEQKSRITYARAFVEIEASKVLPRSVEYVLPSGQYYSQVGV